MKTETKKVTGAELLQLASTDAAITKVTLLNETSDRLECTYEITIEVDPTLEELIDELKEICNKERNLSHFGDISDLRKIAGIAEQLEKLVLDRPSDSR